MRVQRTMSASANFPRFATEAALDMREAERDCYRQLTSTMRGRAVVIQMASHGSIGKERASEMAWRDSMPGCRGNSCRQGRMPCRERCNAEMACVGGGDAPEPRTPTLSIWTRLRLFWIRLRASF